MNRRTVDIVCHIVRDDPTRGSIAITDGSLDPESPLRQREKWFFIPRSQVIDCEPPISRLRALANGARDGVVTLTIPEWLAKDRGLI